MEGGGTTPPPKPQDFGGGFEIVDGVLFMKGFVKIPLEQHVHNIKNMAMREDDVIIAALPKCGTHWIWEVVRMLVRGKPEYDARTKEHVTLEFTETDKLDAEPSPRVLNTHLLMREMAHVAAQRPRVVHVIRNPKDVAVSTYFHLKQIRDNMADKMGIGVVDFCRSFLHGGAFKGTQLDYFTYMHEMFKWQKDHPEVPTINIYFEDAKKDPVQCVQQLARFLKVDASEQLCRDIADQCSFDKLKQADDTYKQRGTDWERNLFKDGVAKLYRKGEVGDWKNHFTEALSEEYDRLVPQQLEGLDLKLQYTI